MTYSIISVIVGVIFLVGLAVAYYAGRNEFKRKKVKRCSKHHPPGNPYGAPFVFLCDDKSKTDEDDEPKKGKLTDEEKKALAKKRDAKSPATLLKRAQTRISKFIADEDRNAGQGRVVKLTVLYGRDEDDATDIRAFAEFMDKAVGFYYANVDPAKDAWVFFDNEIIPELTDLFDRQKNR